MLRPQVFSKLKMVLLGIFKVDKKIKKYRTKPFLEKKSLFGGVIRMHHHNTFSVRKITADFFLRMGLVDHTSSLVEMTKGNIYLYGQLFPENQFFVHRF